MINTVPPTTIGPLTESVWESTLTFFPLFSSEFFAARCHEPVCIVGAADGKFVLPLARKGVRVVAIESDPTQVYGGNTEGMHVEGLLARLHEEQLTALVDVVVADFMKTSPRACYSAIFTSCSWHYPQNCAVPLSRFIGKMQQSLLPAGLFAAEYMMPVTSAATLSAHYPQNTEVLCHFPSARWRTLGNVCTGPFVEPPHIGQPFPHEHCMGFMMARKRQ